MWNVLRARSWFRTGGWCVLWICCSTVTTNGDVVETADGKSATGTVRAVREGVLTITPSGNTDAPQQFEFVNLLRVTIDPYIDRRQLASLLIDNDGAQVGRTLSARVKLRAGLHRIVIPYWHHAGNAMLRMQVSGPKQSLRVVPASMLLHLAENATEMRSQGIDGEGFRRPETVTGKTSPGLLYTLHTLAAEGEGATVRNFVRSKVTAQTAAPTMDRIGPKPIFDQSGLVLSGFLKIDHDGEYTFLLTSDGGSQLYLGPTPRPFRAIEAHREKPPWLLEFVTGQAVAGRLVSWRESTVGFEISTVDGVLVLDVPLAFIRGLRGSVTATDADGSVPVSALPNLDTVFARTNANKILPVPGHVTGVDGDSLLFRYENEDRRVKLDGIARIVLASDRPRPPQVAKFHHALSLFGNSTVPGFWKSFSENAVTFETLWGQMLTLSIDDVSELSVRNGRLVYLSDLEPTAVEQVPFFDRIIPYRANQSLAGGPLQLRDGPHERGLSVHARTVLHYELSGRFQRFQGIVGFDHPMGDIGRAAVRVLGDERALFDKPDFAGADRPENLDLDVTGIVRLSLVVDFGENQDVGDRVIWADVRLLRSHVEQ